MRLLFVCLGNICRSPTAEGVMRELVREAGLQDSIELDSAGTGSWHVGSRPDRRASAAARVRGVALEGCARTIGAEDFGDFDLVLAMDRENLSELRRLAPDHAARAKVRLLREFDPTNAGAGERRRVGPDGDRRGASAAADLDVPDPYYGASGGFDEVFEIVQTACKGLLQELREAQAR